MNWLAGSIRNKLIAVFASGMALVVVGALYGFAAARGGLEQVGRVNDTLIEQTIRSQAMQASFKEQVQAWMGVMVRGHDADVLEKSWKQFGFREREVRRDGEKLLKEVELAGARELLEKFLAAHAAMGEKYQKGLETFKTSGFDSKKVDAELKGIDRAPTELIEELVGVMRDEAQSAVAGARRDATRKLAVSLAVIAAATVAALVACSLLLVRTVVRPLADAVRVADKVAEGDLTVEVASSSPDETGRLLRGLRKMKERLAEAVTVIRQSAESVRTASNELATGHANLSSRTEQQASSLEETAASMEELATTVKQNTENARHANQLAAGASDTAGQGGKVMSEAVDKMTSIVQASRKIGEIIGVIDGIAFQTNILALNAAVEAARAGEQGRGFAVVASEVRALAQKSATAAKEIRDLIQNSVDEVGEGTRLVEAAGKTMQEIVASVRRVTDVMSEIAAASQEQLSGIEQVSRAVEQMDQVVQQNAALVEESAAATENMAAQAEQLLNAVVRFKLDGAGDDQTLQEDVAHTDAQERQHDALRLPSDGAERLQIANNRA
jgi:methyl-accepting chemotaxis protein-1 (serine sensor receptor)